MKISRKTLGTDRKPPVVGTKLPLTFPSVGSVIGSVKRRKR